MICFLVGWIYKRLIERWTIFVNPLFLTTLIIIYIGAYSMDNNVLETSSMCLLCFGVLIRLSKYEHHTLYRILCYIGKRTLVIYLLHYFILLLIPNLYGPYFCGNVILSIISSLVVSSAIIAIILMAERLFAMNKWTKLLILGKR